MLICEVCEESDSFLKRKVVSPTTPNPKLVSGEENTPGSARNFAFRLLAVLSTCAELVKPQAQRRTTIVDLSMKPCRSVVGLDPWLKKSRK